MTQPGLAFIRVKEMLQKGMTPGNMHHCLIGAGRLAGGFHAAGHLNRSDVESLSQLAESLSIDKAKGRRTFADGFRRGQGEPVYLKGSNRTGTAAACVLPIIAKPKPAVNPENRREIVARIVRDYPCTEQDLRALSPVAIRTPGYRFEAPLFVDSLYSQQDYLVLGEKKSNTVRSVSDWLARLCTGTDGMSNFSINPLTGSPLMVDGVEQWKGVANVAKYRFWLAENDDESFDTQFAFCRYLVEMRAHIVAVIHSGRRSLHILFKVPSNVTTLAGWEQAVKTVHKGLLEPLGFCRTSGVAQGSRLPGHWREDSQAWQRLVYFDPMREVA